MITDEPVDGQLQMKMNVVAFRDQMIKCGKEKGE